MIAGDSSSTTPLLTEASLLFDSGSEASNASDDDEGPSRLAIEKSRSALDVPASKGTPIQTDNNMSSRLGKDIILLQSSHAVIAMGTPPSQIQRRIASCLIALVWPLMWTVPLVLSNPSSPLFYQHLFPSSWYQPENNNSLATVAKPLPLGLLLGILAVAVGQVWVWILFYVYRTYGNPTSIQSKGPVSYEYPEGLHTHVAQPEGFGLLVGYLAGTWLLSLMPSSYYNFDGTIQWNEVVLCLILQDGIQYTMHMLEHLVSPAFYQISHKPHHRFTNPRLFDAFNGSLLDTLCMINLPLFVTAHIVRNANVWTYMTFGSTYACWLTLIHSEYVFPWDGAFRLLGLGTPGDHHVHHKFFKYNYGHLFMWFDRIGGTYRDPRQFAPKVFNEDV